MGAQHHIPARIIPVPALLHPESLTSVVTRPLPSSSKTSKILLRADGPGTLDLSDTNIQGNWTKPPSPTTNRGIRNCQNKACLFRCFAFVIVRFEREKYATWEPKAQRRKPWVKENSQQSHRTSQVFTDFAKDFKDFTKVLEIFHVPLFFLAHLKESFSLVVIHDLLCLVTSLPSPRLILQRPDNTEKRKKQTEREGEKNEKMYI